MLSTLLPTGLLFQISLHPKANLTARRILKLSIKVLLAVAAQSLSVSTVYATHEPAQITDIVSILQKIIRLLAPAAAIAFFIMLLVGGFQFLTSGGDPKAAGAARSTLTYAIIGIILVIVAWLILKLIAAVTGADVTTVEIP